jgi:hypothetical protein
MSIFVALKDAASEGIKKLAGTVQDSTKSWDKAGGSIGMVTKAFAALGGAMAVGSFFKKAIEEAQDAQREHAALSTAITNAGDSFADMAPHVDAALEPLTRLTAHADGDLRMALARLISVSGDSGKSIENIGLVADLASARQMDLGAAADLVGKAMVGQTSSLSRYGIIVEEGADAVQVMRDRFAGFAEAEGQTLTGVLARLREGFNNVAEATGTAILANDGLGGSADGLIGMLASVEGWIRDNSDAISGFIGWVIDLGEQLISILKPFWDVGVMLLDSANKLGILEGAWKSVRVVMMVVGEALGALAGMFKSGMGMIMMTIGAAIDLASPLLRKLGMEIGDVGERMKLAGQKMVLDVAKSAQQMGDRVADQFWLIMAGQEEHEQQRTKLATGGTDDRIDNANREGAELTKAQKEAHRALERADAEFGAVFGKKAPAYVAAVTKAILAQNEALKNSSLLTAEQQAQLAARRAELERTLPLLEALAEIETDQERVELLEDQGARLAELRELYDRTKTIVEGLTPDTEGWNAATGRQRDLGKQIKALADDQLEAYLEQREVQDTIRATLAVTRLVMGDLTAAADLWEGTSTDVADETERTQEALLNAARGTIELAVEFAGLDQTSARVLHNVVNLADTLKAGFGSLAAGDVIGAVGAVAGILGSIFGGNDENKQIMRENNRRMLDLREGIREQVRLSAPGARIAAVESALSGFAAVYERNSRQAPDFAKNSVASASLFGVAQAAGVRVSEIEEIAKELGITIKDSEGKIVAGAVQQLLEVLRGSDLTGYGNTAQGRMSQLDAEFAVRGTVSAHEQLQRRLAVLMEASPLFREQLGGFDVRFDGGLQGALSQLVGLVPNLGNFDVSTLGDLGRQETIDWATRLADLIRTSLEESGTGTPGEGTFAGLVGGAAADTGVGAGAVPVIPLADLMPEAQSSTANDLARAADGIERLDTRLVEVRDAILRTSARRSSVDGSELTLALLVDEIDQELATRREQVAIGQGTY